MKSRILAIGAATALAIGLSACATNGAGSDASSDEKPFRIVYVGGITGNLASVAKVELAAIDLALAKVNADGGIDGRKVTVESLDDKSDPTEAVSVLQKRLSEGNPPDLIRAGTSSPEALALVPVANRAGIPTVSSAASDLLDDPTSYPLHKSVTPGFNPAIELIKDYLVDKKAKTLVMMVPEDASGDSVLAGAEKLFAKSGITIKEARYNLADLDLSVAFQRAIEGTPDAIYVNCIGAACARVVQARGSVAEGVDIPMFGDSSMTSAPGGLAAGVDPALIKNLYGVGYRVQVDEPKLQADATAGFLASLDKKVGVPPVITSASVAYDCVLLWAQGAKKAGTTDPKAVIKAIDSTKWPRGSLISFGDVPVTWEADRTFVTLPKDALVLFAISPQVNGLYPPKELYTAK